MKTTLIFAMIASLSIQQGRNAIASMNNNQAHFNPYQNPVIPYCFLGNDPVCSVANETFVNECVLMLLGQLMQHRGWCAVSTPAPADRNKTIKTEIKGYLANGKNSDDPKCPMCNSVFNPVCGVNGVTYANLCKLRECARVEKSNDGPCGVPDYVEPLEPRNCPCRFNFAPACGSDHVTYQDSCLLICAGQTLQNNGPCLRKCGCTKIYKPVCGTNRKSYNNACEMKCDGQRKLADGPCPIPKPKGCEHCDGFTEPVCGINGVTYDNMCYLHCAKVELYSKSPCPSNRRCNCPNHYLPVCGIDNKTYRNECLLECRNIRRKYNGICKSVEVDNSEIYGKCRCGPEIQPICGADGRTYLNQCYLNCLAGGDAVHMGECQFIDPSFCNCNENQSPVCGADFKTYKSECALNCMNQKVEYGGKCNSIGFVNQAENIYAAPQPTFTQ